MWPTGACFFTFGARSLEWDLVCVGSLAGLLESCHVLICLLVLRWEFSLSLVINHTSRYVMTLGGLWWSCGQNDPLPIPTLFRRLRSVDRAYTSIVHGRKSTDVIRICCIDISLFSANANRCGHSWALLLDKFNFNAAITWDWLRLLTSASWASHLNWASFVLDTTDDFYLSLLDVHPGHFCTTNAQSTHGWDWTCSIPICKDRLAHILSISCSSCILLRSHCPNITTLLLILTSSAIVHFFLHLHRAIHVGLWVAKGFLALSIEDRPATLIFSNTA